MSSPAEERIAIVNADDLGYDPEIDRGILEASERGLVTSATVLVTMPFAQAAVEAARKGRLGLGLHVNLVRGKPLTPSPSFVQANGEMDESLASRADPNDVTREVHAQIDRFRSLAGMSPTHLDVHRHAHRYAPILAGILVAARDRRLPVRAIDDGMRSAVRAAGIACPDHFLGKAEAEPWWTVDRLLQAARAMPPGVTEIMCHPGYRPVSVTSRYSSQREVELASLTDPAVRESFTASGVKLCHFGQAFERAT